MNNEKVTNETAHKEMELLSEVLCPVVSLRDYTPLDKIKHVTFSRMEIEQVYECATCGPLQVVNGVCIHTKPEEDHEWVE